MRYPQKLCLYCRRKLDAYSNFREKCLMLQTKYRKEFLNNPETSKQPEKKPIKIETVLIKEEPSLSLEMTVETEQVTTIEYPIKNEKPDKYWDWSDDDFFSPTDPISGIQSSVTLDNQESEEEFFELVTVEDNDDDNNKVTNIFKIEESTETIETEIAKDEGTESEPDNFDFNEPKHLKRKRTKSNPYGICHVCGKSLLKKSIESHLNWHYG